MILFMTTVTVANLYGIAMETIKNDAERSQIVEKFADDDITVIIDDVYDEIRFISKGEPVHYQFFRKSLHVGEGSSEWEIPAKIMKIEVTFTEEDE